MSTVHAELVRPARMRPQGKQRPLAAMKNTILRYRTLAVFVVHHLPRMVHFVVARQRYVNDAVLSLWRALHECEILLLYRVLFKLPLQMAVGLLCLCHEDDA